MSDGIFMMMMENVVNLLMKMLAHEYRNFPVLYSVHAGIAG